MKHLITFSIMLVFLSLKAQQQYVLSKSSPPITWQGKAAIGNYAPVGTLAIDSATLSLKNDSILALSIKVDMLSLYHDNKQLRKHLRSEDFFEVKKFQQARFVLDQAVAITQEQTQLIGTLIIKDNAKQEIITALIEKDQDRIILRFEQRLNRLDYGITHNSPSVFKSLKENAIADTFLLKGQIEFEIKQ